MRFRNRREAGSLLADQLSAATGIPGTLVLGLPRGGLPVAFEVAARGRLELDVWLVRKIGVPGQPELAMGAIASGGIQLLNEDLIRDIGVPEAVVEQIAARERVELERRDRRYRGDRPVVAVSSRPVIVVDDGLATGSTMRAALMSIRTRDPKSLIVAVPVGARETCRSLGNLADEVICLTTPEPFEAVGLWYDEFTQTTDEEVCRLLSDAAGWLHPSP